jgi:hypothetical protein
MEKTRKVAFLVPFWYRDTRALRRLWRAQVVHYHTWLPATTEIGRCVPQTGKKAASAMVRLLMQWDIRVGREQDFSEFVVREFAPRLMQLGIEPSEVLYTMYGEGPQMLTLGAVESKEKLAEILQSSGWRKLHEKLLMYVTNYKHKVVADNGRNFQV